MKKLLDKLTFLVMPYLITLLSLYNKRWGIETSFREVKYALGLNALHSKKRKLIQQEIYARLILYNFCQRVVQVIKIPKYNYTPYQM
ncbi:transposase [Thomasclavelia cocleata]|uniref:transposase n=1 Tax=Thomasclavelia cocleata TaxID=69824 RepID=UPI003C6F47C9